MRSFDVLSSLNSSLEPAGPDEDVLNVEIVDVGGQSLAVVLPGHSQVTVSAQSIEAVEAALAVSGEVESPGNHADVHQVVDDPGNGQVNKVI